MELEEKQAFRKGSMLARSPAPEPTPAAAGQSRDHDSRESPKRVRDPASPGSSQRLTPPKKSKAHQEATCLENLSELGKILDEV
ncbi:GL24713 [Drosophila persimilis]|uniref:GL24713 n=1 Tax=Drosophila persimilis TaxID=7234 RepID=B4HD62_DROPE|nr:GL24713 [Drosophila persimilis]